MGTDRSTRQLDHCTDKVVDLDISFLHHVGRNRIDPRLHEIEFGAEPDEWHHDFRFDGCARRFGRLNSCFENCPRLHFSNFRVGNGKTAAAMAKHRIELVQAISSLAQLLGVDVHGGSYFGDFLFRLRQEFMQRRVKQANCDRQTIHDFKQFDEIGALHRQQLVEGRTTSFLVVGQDHFAHGDDALAFKEHVLGAA